MTEKDGKSSLGRSLRAGEVTLAEIAKLTKGLYWSKYFLDKTFKNAASPSASYDVVVSDGDLVVDGDFFTAKRRLVGLVVNGSLRISGLYEDSDDPSTGVFVLGDLNAARVRTVGALCVRGSVTVADAMAGGHNDYSARIGGDVTAAIFSSEDHFFEIGGKLRADVVLGNARVKVGKGSKPKELPEDEYRTRLVPEIVSTPEDEEDAELRLDYEAIATRVVAGQPLLRG